MMDSGWELPDDSEYKFDVENGITRGRERVVVGENQRETEKPKEIGNSKKSKRTRK
jgi:hypothetical protein